MATITLYHNARCSKSRQALALLQANGEKFTTVEYLKQPLSATQLRQLLKQCQCEPTDFIRHNEAAFKSTGLDKHSLSSKDVIAAIANDPILMQRPIVSHAGKAVIARPPEKSLDVL